MMIYFIMFTESVQVTLVDLRTDHTGHLVITREHMMGLDELIVTVVCPLIAGSTTLHLHTTEEPPGTTSYRVATSCAS